MTLEEFLNTEQDVVRAGIVHASGSSPREAGTEMFVTPTCLWGTIGGGQLEYMVIDQARDMLARGQHHTQMNVPLGPEIGQCCGGRVEIELMRLCLADRHGCGTQGESRRRGVAACSDFRCRPCWAGVGASTDPAPHTGANG